MMLFALFAQITGLFPVKWPEWLKTIATWALIIIAVVLIFIGLKAAYDASVVRSHEQNKTSAAIEAYDDSAASRAIDAVKNLRANDARMAEIEAASKSEIAKPPDQRATTTPQARAFLCAVLKEEYTVEQLAKMPEYRENCR